MSKPQHPCVRCGVRVHTPAAACRDCRAADKHYTVRSSDAARADHAKIARYRALAEETDADRRRAREARKAAAERAASEAAATA